MTGRRLLAGLAAGLLLTLTLPPFGWWPLGLVGVAVLHIALGWPGGWRARAAVGLAAGIGLYAPGLWWATSFHAAGWVAIVVLESLILAAAVVLVPSGRGVTVVALPAALVLAEAVRGAWPFGGLPLAGLDLGQVGGPFLHAARLGGHLLVVGTMAVVGVALAELCGAFARSRRPSPPKKAWLGTALAGAVLVVVVGATVAPDGSEDGTLAVAAVQGGGPRGLRAVGRDPRPVFDAQVAATRRLSSTPDLVLWPEDVVDVDGTFAGSAEEAEVSALARDMGVVLVAGVVEDVPGANRSRNAAVVFDAEGRQVDRYEKVHRVPFGEYVPFRSFFERLADLSDVPRDAVPGDGPAVLDTPAGRMGVVISYEVFFAGRAREAAREGGRLLLVPTNASSYTTSQVPTQEVATARVRAVETGRWVLQAAPTGYSAVVDHRGKVVDRGPLGDPAVLEATVGLREGTTIATRVGDGPIVGAAVVALALAAWRSRRKHE